MQKVWSTCLSNQSEQFSQHTTTSYTVDGRTVSENPLPRDPAEGNAASTTATPEPGASRSIKVSSRGFPVQVQQVNLDLLRERCACYDVLHVGLTTGLADL